MGHYRARGKLMQEKEVSWLLIWLSGALGGIAMRATSTADFLAAVSAGLVALWLSGVLFLKT